MTLFVNWWQRRLKLGRQGLGAEARQLASCERLLAEIDRERSRADRTAAPFCVLVFPVVKRQIETLAGVLNSRIRATDTAGFLTSRRIAVVLPETPRSGAQVLAGDLRKLLPETEQIACRIYEHPFELPNEPPQDDNHQNRSDDQYARHRRLAEQIISGEVEPRDVVEEPVVEEPVHAMSGIVAQQLPLWKRAVDVCGAAFGLVVLSPVLAASAAAVKLTSKGPIFYKQQRAGLAARPFTMWKFRTMVPNADELKDDLREQNEQDGPAFKIKKDPRVTPIGWWLRKLNIDELPQLWNVLRGEMSLVGPRPLPVEEAVACDVWHHRRLDVTPGLTCYWQVRPQRTDISFDDWVRMDVQYIRQRTPWEDAKLIAKTIVATLLRLKS